MIFGIGVDLVSISRIARVHDKFGERFARRFLSESELTEYATKKNKNGFLAKRFAAKEAAVKALGTGERTGVLLKDFYLTHDTLGKPLLNVCGHAATICETAGIQRFHVSLTDEKDQIVAFAILEN